MSNRRNFTNTTNNNNKSSSTIHQHTNLDDDWETDPDFERHMDEMDQRWGAKRSVGGINMTKLIDEVHNDHKSIMKERFLHPSQSAIIDKHSTSTSSKKIITSSSSTTSSSGGPAINQTITKTNNSINKEHFDTGSRGPSINDMKKTLFERNGYEKETVRPVGSSTPNTTTTTSTSKSYTRPEYARDNDFKERLKRFDNPSNTFDTSNTRKGYETSKSHKIVCDEIGGSTTRDRFSSNLKTSTSSPSPTKTYTESHTKAKEIGREIDEDVPKAFESIQAKIDAYKRELDNLKEEMIRKTHLIKQQQQQSSDIRSNSSKQTEKLQRDRDIEFVDSDRVKPSSDYNAGDSDIHGSIKSMKEKFDKLLREDEEDFKRRTEARRKQFFEEIESQVHETRRGLDDFDNPLMDEEFEEMKRKFLDRNREHLSSPTKQQQHSPSPTYGNPKHVYSSHSSLGGSGLNMPKVYTKRETHREEVVSKIVKENDKVIENETKRNVQHSSSCHGSSDDEADTMAKKIPITVTSRNFQSPSQSPSTQTTSRTRSPAADFPSNNNQNGSSLRNDSPSQRNVLRSQSPSNRASSSDRMTNRSTSPKGVANMRPTNGNNKTIAGAGLMARTLFDYDAAEDDELSFDIDELITNIEKIDVGWYRGIITSKNGSKREGLFPANYVKLLNDDGEY